MESFELRFVKKLPNENDNYAILYKDKRYNGWFKYILDSEEYTEIIVRFRLPRAMVLYDNVMRQFLPEERIFGIHRMLLGKDLQEETKRLLNFNSINDYVTTLDDSSVKELLDRMKDIITFNCNKIPYLHICMKKSLGQTEKDFEKIIKDHLNKYPNYLSIFYNVLNEKITLKEAIAESKGMIYSEYLELIKK